VTFVKLKFTFRGVPHKKVRYPSKWLTVFCPSICVKSLRVFWRRFRDPIQVPRISENCHRVPRIKGIGSLTFSLKKNLVKSIFKLKKPSTDSPEGKALLSTNATEPFTP